MHPLIFRATTPHSPDSWTAGRRRGSQSRLPDISCNNSRKSFRCRRSPGYRRWTGSRRGRSARHRGSNCRWNLRSSRRRSHPRARCGGRGEKPFSHQSCPEPERPGLRPGFSRSGSADDGRKMSFPGFDGRERSEDQDL